MVQFRIQVTIGLASLAAGAIIAGSASSFPRYREKLEYWAGILIIVGSVLVGSLLAPLLAD